MIFNPLTNTITFFRQGETGFFKSHTVGSKSIANTPLTLKLVDNLSSTNQSQLSKLSFGYSLNDSVSGLVLNSLSMKTQLLSSASEDRKISLEESMRKNYEAAINESTAEITTDFDRFFNGTQNSISSVDDFSDVIKTEKTNFNKETFQQYLTGIFNSAMNLAENNNIIETSSDMEEAKNKLSDLLAKQFDSQGDSFEKMSYKDISGLYTGIQLYNSDMLNDNTLSFPVKNGIIKAITEKYISNSDVSSSMKDIYLSNVNNLLERKNVGYLMNKIGQNLNSEYVKNIDDLFKLLRIYNKLEDKPIRKSNIIIVYNPLLKYSPFSKTKFHSEKNTSSKGQLDDYKKDLLEQIDSLKNSIKENKAISNEFNDHPQEFRKSDYFKQEYVKEEALFNETYDFFKNSDTLSDGEKKEKLLVLEKNNVDYKKDDKLNGYSSNYLPVINSLSDFLPTWNEFSKNMVNGEKMLIKTNTYYLDTSV
ncbi:MAG: hypothetical protein Q8936_08305 [Bacillota bacterium]|nr:hypothetical protein [Bacillota bacterium]